MTGTLLAVLVIVAQVVVIKADAPYDFATQTCCAGVVKNNVTFSSYRSCCDTELYNYKTQICCNNTIKARPTNTTQCCGSVAYDSSTHSCVNGIVDGSLNKNTCGGVTLETGEQCCGDQIKYNPDQDTCCYVYSTNEAVVTRNLAGGSCCGTEAYVYDSKNNQLCCSKYDYSSKKSEYQLNSNVDAADDCCGLNTYNPFNSVCCYYSSTSVPRTYGDSTGCCADAAYDKSKEISCCYGNALYNANTEVCCGNYYDYTKSVVTKKAQSNHNSCCLVGGKPKSYNMFTNLCCNNQLTEVKCLTQYCCVTPD